MSGLESIYERLCEEMPTHEKQGLSYISGEQCTARLNEVLGVEAWDFEHVEHWYDRDADCVMWIGRLRIRWPNGASSVHEDVGSQIPNRKRAKEGQERGDIVELGSDFKGARTDCLKRCAADAGIGLWLYHKQEPAQPRKPAPPVAPPQQGVQNAPRPAQTTGLDPRARLDEALAAAKQFLTTEQRDAVKRAAVEFGLPENPTRGMPPAQCKSWAALVENALKTNTHSVI